MALPIRTDVNKLGIQHVQNGPTLAPVTDLVHARTGSGFSFVPLSLDECCPVPCLV
jgi:hypothetical protein